MNNEELKQARKKYRNLINEKKELINKKEQARKTKKMSRGFTVFRIN